VSISAHRLFSNAQRYEQNGEIYQNVALRSARAIVLCVQVGDIFYTDNGAAPQDRPLFLIQCGTVFCTKAGFFDASKYIDTHIVSNGYLFYPVILTDPDPDFQDGPATYKVLGPHSSVAQADIGSADSAGATARRRWFPLVSVWWPMTVQQRIAHAITDHYRELGYPWMGRMMTGPLVRLVVSLLKCGCGSGRVPCVPD